jgi:hypothetical protein
MRDRDLKWVNHFLPSNQGRPLSNGWWRMAPRPSATCVGPGGGAMGDLADEGEPGATVLFA